MSYRWDWWKKCVGGVGNVGEAGLGGDGDDDDGGGGGVDADVDVEKMV